MFMTYKRVAAPLLILLFPALFPSCARQGSWDPQAIQEFYAMPCADSASDLACRKLFDRKIRPSLEFEAPGTMQQIKRLQGGRDPGAGGLGGILRSALFETALKAADRKSAGLALSLLIPALKGVANDPSPLKDSLAAFGDSARFRRNLLLLAGEMAAVSLRGLDSLRLSRPAEAGKRVTDLRYLMLFIPENESVVAGGAGLLWEALDREVNAIDIARVSELLKASWPALIPVPSPVKR